MKKFLSIIQIAIIIFGVVTFSACGSAEPEKPLDAAATLQSLLNEVTYAKELTDISDNAPYFFEGMPQDAQITMYRASGSSYSDQLIMIDAKSADDTSAVIASVNTYLDGLKKQAELYTPEEIQKLNNAVVFDSGNYVFVCITADTEAVHQILGD